MSNPHITDLRQHLRDRENPMEPDRARAIAQVAGVLVDTARVEVDYLKATGQDRSAFLEQPSGVRPLPRADGEVRAHNPFPVSVRHRLDG